MVTATRPLTANEVQLLSEYIKHHGQAFLEKVDNWIVSLPETEQDEEAVETGLGMYHYIESKQDKTSLRELLIERGLDLKDEKSK